MEILYLLVSLTLAVTLFYLLTSKRQTLAWEARGLAALAAIFGVVLVSRHLDAARPLLPSQINAELAKRPNASCIAKALSLQVIDDRLASVSLQDINRAGELCDTPLGKEQLLHLLSTYED